MREPFCSENLDVWKRAAALSPTLFQLADALDRDRKYRFAERLRAAVPSIGNNIAEGAGSCSDREFAHFLNIARRSAFEVVNMLLVFQNAGLASRAGVDPVLTDLDGLSRMLERLRRRVNPPDGRA